MSKGGVTLKDVPADKFIAEYAAHLKKSNWLKLPAWVDLVKTGINKQLPPQNPDWYYVRAGTTLLPFLYFTPEASFAVAVLLFHVIFLVAYLGVR